MFNVGSIVGSLVLDDQFSKPLKDANQATAKSSANLSKTFAMVGVAAAAAAGAVLALANSTAKYRDETTKASRAAGTSVQEFSELRHAAELSGLSMGSLTTAFSRLQSTSASTELSKIGVAMKKNNGVAKTNVELFEEVADKVKNAGTATERTRIAVTAFGRSGGQMVSMLMNGKEGLAEMRQEAIDLGIAFDESAGAQAEKFNDDMDRMQKSVQGLRDSFGQAVIEFLNTGDVLNNVREAIQNVTKWFNNLDKDTKNIIIGTGLVVIAVGLFIGVLAGVIAIAPFVTAAITAMTGGINLLILAVVAVVTALGGAIAFIVVKWDQISEAMGGFENVVKPLKRSLKELKDIFVAMTSGVMDKFKKFFDSVFGQSGARKMSYTTIAIKLVSSEIVKMVGAFRLAVAGLRGLINFMRSAWDMAQGIVANSSYQVNTAMLNMRASIIGARSEITRINAETAAGIRRVWESELSPEKSEKIIDDFGKPLKNGTEKIVEKTEATFQDFASAIQDIAGKVASNMGAIADLAVKKISNTVEKLNFFADRQGEIIKKQNEEELAIIESTEDAKIDAIKRGSIERMALLDEEFQKKKRLADLEFQNFVEKERAEFEIKLLRLQEESADAEQARLATAVMEDDWRKHLEGLEAGHRDNLLNLQTSNANKAAANKKETDAEIVAAEKEKTAKLKAVQDQQAEEEKQRKKKVLLVQALLEYQAFQISKKNAIAQAGISYGMAYLNAVVGLTKLTADLGFVGLALGTTLFAAQTALATQAYTTSIAMIGAQQFIPPAGLFAAEGGQIVGPSHSQGGVNVTAEGGEAFLSRALTNRLDNMIQRDEQQQRGVVINFGSGAFIVQGNMDDSMVDKLSEQIALKIEQRRF